MCFYKLAPCALDFTVVHIGVHDTFSIPSLDRCSLRVGPGHRSFTLFAMITLVFLDPNVFNVLKYVVMSLTISFAADILLDTISGYTTARKLLNRGWAHPVDSSVRLRFHRGVRLRKARSGLTIILTVLSVSILEMALEFSTGANSVWIRRTDVVRVSKQASNASSLLHSGPNYIRKMRVALERVENTCYSVDEMWYHPVLFNMTNSTEFHGLGKSALCPSNFSDPNYVEDDLQESTFLASDVAEANIWNASELRVGRDVDQSEETVPFTEIGDSRIGSTQDYSFLAVNFSRGFLVKGSEKALSGRSIQKQPRALHTAMFTVESGRTLQCLMQVRLEKEEETGEWEIDKFNPEVCLVPIAGNRVVLGLFDDFEDGFQLVMSVALKNAPSFHDLRILRYLPWMVGQNDGLHTYRELGILAVLSGRMVQKISVDGYQDLRIEVGSENITVPTLTIWGIVLLVAGTLFLLVTKIMLSRSRRKMKLRGNLGTVRGVAEQWAQQNEGLEDFNREMGKVVFVLEDGGETTPAAVNVRRESEVRGKNEKFANNGASRLCCS